MQAKLNSGEQQPERTFTETARRAQIVDAAIEVIAEQGYANVSFAKIAKQAGLSSTGMISYHFRGKGDLMREVVAGIMGTAAEYVGAKLDAEQGYRGRMAAFFGANLALADEYPKHMRALSNIAANAGTDDPHLFGLLDQLGSVQAAQVELLRAGQREGVFRDFDPVVMITAIRGALDAAIARAAHDPGFDTAVAARELAELFDRATRKDA
ncbi:TetR/AcrR family transcriptional regulator [Nocardia sp. CDC153]|uniref:TetR/AcrR family transcriptional regulator n=1 Tax=Nocardia sp. CDC153 TaxID=3112167 RepID=UPI002DBE0CC5|nr:TetR/AcrR family transcriptional regulator [Nocardia sp. CDC153]MEC3953660.1 TetR/AcrR family transcriptional regulator [Nocardia sp. CDC153]